MSIRDSVVKKYNSGATASSPIIVEDDSDDGDDVDESPEEYKNLQSNCHINPFKYLNTSSNDTTRGNTATESTLKNWIQFSNDESCNFNSKTLVFKRSNNNTYIKPFLKRHRASDDNPWEYGFTNFKKSKPTDCEFRQHQQIPNLSECEDKLYPIMGGNEGMMAAPPNKNKACRVRSRIASPYIRPNSPSKGIFQFLLYFTLMI